MTPRKANKETLEKAAPAAKPSTRSQKKRKAAEDPDAGDPAAGNKAAGKKGSAPKSTAKKTAGQKAPAAEPSVKKEDKAEPSSQAAAPDVEGGKLYFFFRPKVENEDPKSLNDVQRFHMILQPTSHSGANARLIIVPKKKLPDVPHHERFFAFVIAVAPTVAELAATLGPKTYETKTRGMRHQPAARCVGEGVYTISLGHGGTGSGRKDTRLAYKLQLPLEPGEIQEEMGIEPEGTFLLSIKNPGNKSEGAPSIGIKPEYSAEQLKEFGGYSWTPATNASMLDVRGAELLLIGARASFKDSVGEAAEQRAAAHKEADVNAARAETGERAPEAALAERLRGELAGGGGGGGGGGPPAQAGGGASGSGAVVSSEPAETGNWA